MELTPGKRSPVELKGGTRGVEFGGSSVDAPQGVELVVAAIHGYRIIGLQRRTRLRQSLCGAEENRQQHADWRRASRKQPRFHSIIGRSHTLEWDRTV